MFYDNLKKVCKQQGTSVTAIIKDIGLDGSSGTWWKKGSSPSGDILIKLSERLNVSTDYLLTGKESPKSDISEDEQELLNVYNQLSERSKGMAIGYMQGLIGSGRGSASVDKDISDITNATT